MFHQVPTLPFDSFIIGNVVSILSHICNDVLLWKKFENDGGFHRREG